MSTNTPSTSAAVIHANSHNTPSIFNVPVPREVHIVPPVPLNSLSPTSISIGHTEELDTSLNSIERKLSPMTIASIRNHTTNSNTTTTNTNDINNNSNNNIMNEDSTTIHSHNTMIHDHNTANTTNTTTLMTTTTTTTTNNNNNNTNPHKHSRGRSSSRSPIPGARPNKKPVNRSTVARIMYYPQIAVSHLLCYNIILCMSHRVLFNILYASNCMYFIQLFLLLL